MRISAIYGTIALLSVLLTAGYCVRFSKKNVWLTWLFFSMCVVHLGYFGISVSRSVEGALWGNRVAYLGNVFLPVCMLLTVLDVCEVRYRRRLPVILMLCGLAVCLITATPGWLGWYYKDVTYVVTDGTPGLAKIYGPLHAVYSCYLLGYFAAMIAVILICVLRRRITFWKHAATLAVVVLLNLAIWLVEKWIPRNFEFLAVSYFVSELMLLFLYGLHQDYEQMRAVTAASDGTDTADSVYKIPQPSVPVQGLTPEELEKIWPETAALSPRERDVFQRMLEEKPRKEIAEELCITENTVKRHVTNIFMKLKVANRKELFSKIRELCREETVENPNK